MPRMMGMELTSKENARQIRAGKKYIRYQDSPSMKILKEYYESLIDKNFKEKQGFKLYNRGLVTKDYIVAQYFRFAFTIAHKYKNLDKYLTFDDRFSIAMQGLLKAIESFNVDKGWKFLSYMSVVAENEMNMQGRKIRRLRNAQIIPMDYAYSREDDNKELTVGDMISDDINIEELISDDSLTDVMIECLAEIPERERYTLLLFYAKEMDQKDIARLYGLSQSYVSRLIVKAEDKLRELMIRKEVVDRSAANKVLEQRELKRQKNSEKTKAAYAKKAKMGLIK